MWQNEERAIGRKAVFSLPLICHVCLNWKLIRQWLSQCWGLTVLPICLIWDFLLVEVLKQGVSGAASSRAKSHNTEPLNQHWRCLPAAQGEARSRSWAEQELCSFCWYRHDYQGLTGKFAHSTCGHGSWDSKTRKKRNEFGWNLWNFQILLLWKLEYRQEEGDCCLPSSKEVNP